MRQIDEIILHCTATPADMLVPRWMLDRWHKQYGWSCVGYHFVVNQDGSMYEGRSLEYEGAHCKGHNAHSIGIAYVGGLDPETCAPSDTRTTAQKYALRELIKKLLLEYPIRKISGHYQYAAKACPCFNVDEYQNLLSDPCDSCELSGSSECYHCGIDPELA